MYTCCHWINLHLCLISRSWHIVNDEWNSEDSVDERRSEAEEDDPDSVLQHGDDHLVHQLVQDDQTLQQEECEAGEVEIDVEGDGDVADNIEVTDDDRQHSTEQVDLEANLSHIYSMIIPIIGFHHLPIIGPKQVWTEGRGFFRSASILAC